MQSGIDGTMTVEGICPGEFIVSSSDNSHLKSSVKVVIEKGKKNSITVSLVPASCVIFKLSDQLKKEFEGKFVFVMCSVLDEQGNLVAEPSEFGDSVTERFALVQSQGREATALMLKNGNYKISYKLSSQDPNGEFKKIRNERIVEVAVDGNLEITIN